MANLPTYAAGLGESIVLDGSTSVDLDDYDSITGYRWDLNGDGQFIDGNPTMIVGPFGYPYQARVGLQVNDESFASWSDPVYVDIFFSERDLAVVDLQTEPFNLLDQNFTLVATVESNASSVVSSEINWFVSMTITHSPRAPCWGRRSCLIFPPVARLWLQ